MSRRVTQEDAAKWLTEYAPHIQLLEWGGSSSAPSRFKSTETGYEFVTRFASVKSRIRSGVAVGRRATVHVDSTQVQEAIESYLSKNCPHIEIVTCAPKISEKSVFRNTDTDNTFEFSFSNLKYQVEHGWDVGIGLAEAGRRTSVSKQTAKEDAERWLANNCPHISLVSWSGTWSDDSVFFSAPQQREFTAALKNIRTTVDNGGIPFGEYGRSSLETVIAAELTQLGVSFDANKQFLDTLYRPDFCLHDHRLVIECDGLYWHSDAVLGSRTYHLDKKNVYESAGYRALFFRGDEITEKLDAVVSVIRNVLRMNTRSVGARECAVQSITPDFFKAVHLMGPGSGKCYGLFYENTLVAGMQVRWTKKATRELEISRFASAHNTTVSGGFSKLLAHVERTHNPKKVHTFIDRRYGSGVYLERLGFVHQGTHVSFRWTKGGTISVHRMKFPNDTGYTEGYYRIWDCGQAKWTKIF